MKDRLKPVEVETPVPVKIKEGRVKLILTDKDGKQETVFDHNMPTDGIKKLYSNCGLMNTQNINVADLVEQLIGGVMLLDTALPAQASQVVVPSGVKMTANGALGVVNGGEPLELGSYDSETSGSTERGRGWQDDGSYVQAYFWSNSQGNGTIASICATGYQAGLCGIGNPARDVLSSRVQVNQFGSMTDYAIDGVPCKIDFVNNCCYAIDFDLTNDKIIINKVHLPLTKFNVKSAPDYPIILDAQEIALPAGLKTCIENCNPWTNAWWNAAAAYGIFQDTGETLNVISRGGLDEWGDYTPTLWEIDPVNGTIATSTLSNTSGDTLHTICQPVWLGRNKLAWIDGIWSNGNGRPENVDGRTVYYMERTNGTWGNIQKYTNPMGSYQSTYVSGCGWYFPIFVTDFESAGKGRAYMATGDNDVIVFDVSASPKYVLPTNGRVGNIENSYAMPTPEPLISHQLRQYNGRRYLRLIRNQFNIATIYNLESAVVKNSERSMTLIYTFYFEEAQL